MAQKKFNLSDIQSANLNLMAIISEHAKSDRAAVCCQFGIEAKQAEFLAQLPLSRMMVYVSHIDESLFKPRVDFVQLFDWQPQLAGIYLKTQFK